MQFHLHADYAKARTAQVEPRARRAAVVREAVPPPRAVRAGAARALASVALRLDGDSATRRLMA